VVEPLDLEGESEAPGEGAIEGAGREFMAHRGSGGMVDYLARAGVEHDGQMERAFARAHVGDVGDRARSPANREGPAIALGGVLGTPVRRSNGGPDAARVQS